jgi:site-specific recombinase XerD
MAGEGVPLGELRPGRVEEFVMARKAAGYRHFLTPHGLSPIVAYLRAVGVVPQLPAGAPVTAAERFVRRYRRHLVDERGLAAGTARYYGRIAGLFLSKAGTGEDLDLSLLTPAKVSRFVLDESRRRSVGSAKTLVAGLRSLLRFLHREGLTCLPLVGAVPAVAPWPGVRRANGFDEAAVAGLLASCDRRTGTGRRDFAILVLLARLGLRAGEVAALELDDLDWRAGQVVVRGKGGRRDVLPLPVDVGAALAGYLRRGRPQIPCRRVFLRVKAPVAGLTGDGVTNVVRAACRRAGLAVAGAHQLRHFVATAGLRQGSSLTEIGQLLRQGAMFTTSRYAKVDRAGLSRLARRWPGSPA